MGKIVLTAVIALLCLLIFTVFNTIHEPVVPNPISLPLGEHNRLESAHIRHDSYVEVEHMTLSSLPKEAWCTGQSSSAGIEQAFTLRCVWVRSQAGIPYAVASVPIAVPQSTDVARWELDRQSLSAVPIPREWFLLNFGSIMLMVILSLITILLGFCWIAMMLPRPRDIDSVDHGLT
ncbi:MAG TPA: hypothetical protein VGE31_01085 [Candidatus Paceibacterota bacterium]